METFWNNFYEEMTEVWTRPEQALVEIVSPLKPGKALDLGAGQGADSVWLATQGWEVTAVDYSDVAMKQLQEKHPQRVTTWCGDMLQFPFTEKYDLICFCYIHLPENDRKEILQKASEALAPAGMLVYLGMTNISHPGIDPAIFAPSQTVAADIPLKLLKIEDAPRMIDWGEGPEEKMGTTVIAQK